MCLGIVSKVEKRINGAVLAVDIELLANATRLQFSGLTGRHIPLRRHGASGVTRLTCVVTLGTSAGEISLSRLPVASSSSSSSLNVFLFLLLNHSSLPSTNPRTGRLKSVLIFEVFSYLLSTS
jgi:hypothetical protein